MAVAGMEGRRVGKMHGVFALPTTNVLYLRYLLGRAAVVMTWCDWSRMVYDRQLINDTRGRSWAILHDERCGRCLGEATLLGLDG